MQSRLDLHLKNLFDKLTEGEPDYIPLTRVMDKMNEQMHRGKRGAANPKSAYLSY